MSDKEKIIEMIQSMNNADYLFKIYHYVLAKYRREKEEYGLQENDY